MILPLMTLQDTIKFVFEVDSDVSLVDIIVDATSSDLKAGVSGSESLRICVRNESTILFESSSFFSILWFERAFVISF